MDRLRIWVAAIFIIIVICVLGVYFAKYGVDGFHKCDDYGYYMSKAIKDINDPFVICTVKNSNKSDKEITILCNEKEVSYSCRVSESWSVNND